MNGPYPSYCDSGVEWLGSIPVGWRSVRLGELFTEVVEAGVDGLPILSVSIHDGVSDDELSPEDLDRKVTRSEDKSKYKQVRQDDLVYNMMRAWQGGFGSVRVEGMVSPAYVVARPRCEGFDTTFVELVLRTPNAVREMKRHSRGVTDFRLRLYWDDFKALRVPLPPIEDQKTILTYLDRETAKIDDLVAEQQRLIELLQEKRQAVISHAATKGLDPTAPVKDSEIEWVGKVPANWEIIKLKYLVMENQGIQLGPFGGMLLDLGADETGFKVFGQENTISGDFARGDRWITAERYEELSRYKLDNGDVVLTRKGSLGNARLITELPVPGIIDSDTIRVRPNPTLISPQLLAFLLHKAGYVEQQISTMKRGAILAGLNSETIANLIIVLPPRREQDSLLEAIDGEVTKIQDLIAEVEAAIALLQERRAALISAVVTGKIDVRHISTAAAEAA